MTDHTTTYDQSLLIGGVKKTNDKSYDKNDSNLEPNLNEDLMFYQNNALHKHDEKLIDKEVIESKARKLYDNYHSEDYQNYLKVLTIIPKRFMKKNYQVKYEGSDITIYQIPKTGQPKEIHKIKGPKYVDISSRLDELSKTIKVERADLLDKYNNLLISDNILPLEKNKFVEDKKQFLNNLHEYYAYKKFHMDINHLHDDNKKRIVLFDLVKDKHQSNDLSIDNLEGDEYMIREETIQKINEQKLNKLKLYNTILKNLKGLDNQKKDKDTMKALEDDIREYLDMSKEKENDRLIDLEIKASKSMVNYAVIDLPSVTNIDKLL